MEEIIQNINFDLKMNNIQIFDKIVFNINIES